MDNIDIFAIWQETLKILENEVSSLVTYETWMLPMQPVSLEDDVFTFEVNDTIQKNMIETRHKALIQNALKYILKRPVTIQLFLKGEEIKKIKPVITEKQVNKVSVRSSNGLTPKYRFENFVVGGSNKMAYSAALAVSEMPGTTEYNPLFLYGGVGLGKTHLMNAIGNEALADNPDTKISYLSCEKFMNELIESIGKKTGTEFRAKYRQLDILLIDDIQFISNKTGTQEEFFHTFNELIMDNKQIVISSDRPPSEIELLEERLKSRFGSGLMVDLKLPDFETRTAILKKKAKMLDYTIPDDVIKYIAENIRSNIRELEGILKRVMFYSKIYPGEITIEMAELAISDMIKMNKPKITVDYIQEVVAAHYGFTPEDLKNKQRYQSLATARQVAMYLCRKMLDEHYKEIGKKFGNKDHSTVISACTKIGQMIENDEDFKNTVLNLEKKINGK